MLVKLIKLKLKVQRFYNENLKHFKIQIIRNEFMFTDAVSNAKSIFICIEKNFKYKKMVQKTVEARKNRNKRATLPY